MGMVLVRVLGDRASLFNVPLDAEEVIENGRAEIGVDAGVPFRAPLTAGCV